MNKSQTKFEQVVYEQIMSLCKNKSTVVRIRLSQPPAGDWLAGAWAELGNMPLLLKNQTFVDQFRPFLALFPTNKNEFGPSSANSNHN